MTADELNTYLKSLHGSKAPKSATKSSPSAQKPQPTSSNTPSTSKPASAAGHTYENYRQKWDRFDADAAIRSLDGNDQATEQTPTAAPKSDAHPVNSQAEQWKDRGNAHFKSGAFKAAIECYTSSINCHPTCVGYANRAMAKLKLNDYSGAEQDCTLALELDSSYVKAWLRRGAARRDQGSLEGAIEDFEAALRLEPGNKAAGEDRRACIEKWRVLNGVVHGIEPIAVPVELKGPSPSSTMGTLEGGINNNRKINAAEGAAGGDLLMQVSTKRSTNVGDADIVMRPATKAALIQEVVDDEEESEIPPMLPGQILSHSPVAEFIAPSVEGLPRDEPMDLGESETGTAKEEGTTPSSTPPLQQPLPLPPTSTPPITNASSPSPTLNSGNIPLLPISPSNVSSVASISGIKPPRTGVEFERAWRGFKGDMAEQKTYLLQIPASQLPMLLKQVLTPGLLAALQIAVLSSVVKQNPEHAVALLGHLYQVPRFSMNVMSLSGTQKKQLANVWDEAVAVYPDLAPLRSKYSV